MVVVILVILCILLKIINFKIIIIIVFINYCGIWIVLCIEFVIVLDCILGSNRFIEIIVIIVKIIL